MLKENEAVFIEPVGDGFVVGQINVLMGDPEEKSIHWTLGSAVAEVIKRVYGDAPSTYQVKTIIEKMNPLVEEAENGN